MPSQKQRQKQACKALPKCPGWWRYTDIWNTATPCSPISQSGRRKARRGRRGGSWQIVLSGWQPCVCMHRARPNEGKAAAASVNNYSKVSTTIMHVSNPEMIRLAVTVCMQQTQLKPQLPHNGGKALQTVPSRKFGPSLLQSKPAFKFLHSCSNRPMHTPSSCSAEEEQILGTTN